MSFQTELTKYVADNDNTIFVHRRQNGGLRNLNQDELCNIEFIIKRVA